MTAHLFLLNVSAQDVVTMTAGKMFHTALVPCFDSGKGKKRGKKYFTYIINQTVEMISITCEKGKRRLVGVL